MISPTPKDERLANLKKSINLLGFDRVQTIFLEELLEVLKDKEKELSALKNDFEWYRENNR